MNENAVRKASTIKPGDRIGFNIGKRVYFDRVSDVRHIRDGLVHIDINDNTGVLIFKEDELVDVA